MKILIACEFSGIVRDAFIRKGHDAWSCDILPSESDFSSNHYQCDVMEVIGNGWDMMIAHPPCTYLSNAAAGHLHPGGIPNINIERYEKGLKGREFFMAFYNALIPKIAIENPVPSRVYDLPPYAQIIHPYYFGDTESKRTCLWLKNLPPLEKTNLVKPKIYGYYKRGNKKGQPIYGNNYLKLSPDRGKIRSKFFPGIASAMADQWGSDVI